VEFLSDVLANGPVPARDIIQNAEDAGIAEKTLRRVKKRLGVVAYREGEAGQRGAGRWLWKLPIADLATGDDKGGQASIQDGHADQVERVGHLDPPEEATSRESGLSKRDVQDSHHDDLDSQANQDGQHVDGGHLERCNHGYPRGEGCYLCDPSHPYRIEQEETP
jgi:hypothetical protein